MLRFMIFLLLLLASPVMAMAQPVDLPRVTEKESAQVYLDFLKQVYDKMDEEYYMPVSVDAYSAFLKKFETKIYPELHAEHKSVDFIRWRAAAYLVDDLKASEDRFSMFFPPKPAKQFEYEALGKKVDLGITGQLAGGGFLVTNVEPHSNSYLQGLRVRDVIVKIDDQAVASLTQKDIEEKLTPLEGSKVVLNYMSEADKQPKTIEVISAEYFKQTVFLRPVDVPGIYCLEVPKFNQKTADDMLTYLDYIQKIGDDKGLILDFRNNPGGPPLAAREIAAFFLTPKEEFAYFQRKGRPKSSLDVPEIPEKYRYHRPMVILINDKSGSASELFSGVMQRRARAYLMGINSAGAVFLKSMFNFDDSSMVLLVTARGYHSDGATFSFDGVAPDEIVGGDKDLIHFAAEHLLSVVKTNP